MTNFFYFDQTNQKRGPVTEQQLKELAMQGAIGPQTPMETDSGHKGVAGQIPGIFDVAPLRQPQPKPVPAPQPAPKDVFCTNCGNSVAERTDACMSCGAKPTGHKKFCRHCAAALNPEQVVCTKWCRRNMGGFAAAFSFLASAACPLYTLPFFVILAICQLTTLSSHQ